MGMNQPSTATPATGRPYGGEPKEARMARRRQQFLQAGLEVFGTTGFRSATVRGLCKQAGLADRYFYESFDSLEDVLVGSYLQQTDRLKASILGAITATPSSPTSPPSLSAVVRAALEALFQAIADPRVARLCWLEVLGVNPRIDALYAKAREEFAALLASLARAHAPAWSLPADEERALSEALVGSVSQSIQNWVMTGYRSRPELIIRANLMIFDGVMMRLNLLSPP